MEYRFLHTITRCLLVLPALLSASCTHDAEVVVEPPAGEMMLDIGLKIPTRTVPEGYETGEAYENYIDVAGGNYRIYFFDAVADTLIARFESEVFVTVEDDDYVEYSVLGIVPQSLAGHKNFKMVVLANWPQYRDDVMKPGNKVTIADICNADWAQYECPTDKKAAPESVAPDPDAGILMPFYGVHEYKDVEFRPGLATVLDEPVTLLRAMAKVEVILETDTFFNLSFSSLLVNRYNAKGYCAPADVFRQGDYDHGGSWEDDYVHATHLVGGENDGAEKTLACRLARQWNEGGKRYEKWTAYLPEYRNIGAGDACSCIQAKFNVQLTDDSPHTIYFANYSDGHTDNTDGSDGNRLDIERNNVYRFRVTCTAYDFRLSLTVSDWEGVYENTFDFGNGQIVSPVSPWEDEIANDVEF